ncbi:unnamed protein product [marine sediment metagenome]|uniref:Uncharacterized protein n=1 Tax=marine sediment metagenome TaxID=412755 RepID=X0WUK3_9ZZZZ
MNKQDLLIRDITCICKKGGGQVFLYGSGRDCECLIEFVNGEETTILIDSISLRRKGGRR